MLIDTWPRITEEPELVLTTPEARGESRTNVFALWTGAWQGPGGGIIPGVACGGPWASQSSIQEACRARSKLDLSGGQVVSLHLLDC